MPQALSVREYADERWLPRKVAPLVRATLADTYRSHLRRHILPAFGEKLLTGVTPPALETFRATLIDAQNGNGLKVKTARDIIDGTFRALYRDARQVDRLVTDDPFAVLKWPAKIDPEPDPFTADERDLLLDYFWRKDRHYYPFVFLQFWAGLRPGEAIGLRRGDVDLRHGMLSIRRSRTMGEDNPPKTKRSRRTITLLPGVVAVLRDMPASLHTTEDMFLFTTLAGGSIEEERFVEKHWRRALRATGVRPRKFYATRHSFISMAVSRPGISLKWVAEYCGTSVEMIERHYGRYMHGDAAQLALLAPGVARQPQAAQKLSLRGREGETSGETFGARAGKRRRRKGGGGAIRTPEGLSTLAVFKTAALNRARPPLPRPC